MPFPVYGDAELPTEVDVVVIGGGIIGALTALALAERGQRVALCEKDGSATNNLSECIFPRNRSFGEKRFSKSINKGRHGASSLP